LLGHGFEAFWVRGNVDAEGLWQYGQVPNRFGFNFHNTLIELLVHLGIVGATLFILVFLVGALFLFRSSVRRPSLASGAYVSLMVFHLARTPFESLMPSSVDFATLLLVAALAFGFDARFDRPAEAAMSRPRHWRGAAPPAWGARSARPLRYAGRARSTHRRGRETDTRGR
jgi:exopolysaccharide production protein ExoQ